MTLASCSISLSRSYNKTVLIALTQLRCEMKMRLPHWSVRRWALSTCSLFQTLIWSTRGDGSRCVTLPWRAAAPGTAKRGGIRRWAQSLDYRGTQSHWFSQFWQQSLLCLCRATEAKLKTVLRSRSLTVCLFHMGYQLPGCWLIPFLDDLRLHYSSFVTGECKHLTLFMNGIQNAFFVLISAKRHRKVYPSEKVKALEISSIKIKVKLKLFYSFIKHIKIYRWQIL